MIVYHRLNIIATGLAANTIVTGANPSLPVFDILVDGTTIQGFTINGATDSSGIHLDNVQNCNINGNILQNNGYGISLDDSSANITNNIINNIPGDGIGITGGSGSVIIRNTITNSGSRDGSVAAITLFETNNNQVIGNTIVNGGINLVGSENPSNGNNIQNNDIGYHPNGLYTLGYGINLSNANNNIIKGNNLHNNDYGLYLESSTNNIITNNNMTGNTIGINFIESNNNQIYYNDIYNNGQNAVMDTNSNNNHFNTTNQGNYWGGSSIPDNNNDGIIDNSYIIPGISDITDTSTPLSPIYARDTINNRTLMIWDGVYGQIINDDGTFYGNTINISLLEPFETGGTASSVVFNPEDQKYLALWSLWSTMNNAEICFGQFINDDGTLDGTPIILDTQASNPIGVFESSNPIGQQYLIFMQTAKSSGYGPFNLFWKYLNPIGNDDRNYITNYNSDYGAGDVWIAMDNNNNRFLVSWLNRDNYHQYALILNSDGTPYSSTTYSSSTIDLGHALDYLHGFGGPVTFDNINNRYLLTFGANTILLMNADGTLYKTIDMGSYLGGYFNPGYMDPRAVVFDPLAQKFIISYFTGHWEGIAQIISSDGTIDNPWFYLFTGIYNMNAYYGLIYTNNQNGILTFANYIDYKFRFIKVDTSDNLPYKNIISNVYGLVTNTRTLETFDTIQDAIDNAIDGDTIKVVEGTYNENVIVNKQLNIIATGLAANTIIKGADPAQPVFNIQKDGTTIQGFTIIGTTDSSGIQLNNVQNCNVNANIIQNNGIGIDLEGCTNCNINGDTIQNNGEGIYLGKSTNCSINGNTLQNNSVGIYLDNSSSAISGNIISNNNYGIFLGSSNDNNISNNTLTNNYEGIYLSSSNNNTMNQNNITISSSGIRLDDGSYKNIASDNIITNCVLDGIHIDGGAYQNVIQNNSIYNNNDGIGLEGLGTNNNQIIGNNIYSNSRYGIYFEGTDSNIISDNEIHDNTGAGILLQDFEDGLADNNAIIGNNIFNNQYGIESIQLFDRTNTNIINFNRICNNRNSGLIYTGTENLNAENNWWGINTDPGSQLQGNVDYNPWLVLTVTVNPTTIPVGGSSTVTADLTHDNTGAYHDPLSGHIPDGTPVTFTSTSGSYITPVPTTLTNGQAQATFSAAQVSSGTVNVSAAVDGVTIQYPINIGSVTNTRTFELFGNIQDAINSLDTLNGDTLQLISGTLIENNIDVTKSLTITGSGILQSVIDGNGIGRIFYINPGLNVNISNLILKDGNANQGGAIENLGTLTITNSTFNNNTATGAPHGWRCNRQ